MIEKVLKFWYPNDRSTFRPEWFKSELDQPIRKEYGELFAMVEGGMYEDWKKCKYGKLAYIIVLDQFTRNLSRDCDFRRKIGKADVFELEHGSGQSEKDCRYYACLFPMRSRS